MPLDLASAGGSRSALAQALAALTRRYAGADRGSAERPFVPAGGVPPGLLPVPPGTGAFPTTPDVFPRVAPAAGAPAAGGIAADGYGTEGWAGNGVNLFNPNLARGDMAAPGPVGVGPGNWTMDNYGTPFWRSDWENRNGQWVIKGSSW